MSPKKVKRTTLKNKADREFSLFIRERDMVCQSCGFNASLQCAHIFSRGYMQTRWDPDNAMALCAGCHKRFTHDPIGWEDFVVLRVGRDSYDELRLKARGTKGKVDYEQTLEEIAKWRRMGRSAPVRDATRHEAAGVEG